MNIAIIAQDTKKELMVQFCIAYCGILGKHKLCSTSRTGKLVSDATGLSISRDPMNQNPDADYTTLLRLCDVHNIPVATNIATAEALIHALERGDLDWRDLLH